LRGCEKLLARQQQAIDNFAQELKQIKKSINELEQVRMDLIDMDSISRKLYDREQKITLQLNKAEEIKKDCQREVNIAFTLMTIVSAVGVAFIIVLSLQFWFALRGIGKTKEEGLRVLSQSKDEIQRQRRISNLLMEIDDLLNREHKPEIALEVAKEVLDLDPDNKRALSYLATIYLNDPPDKEPAAQTYEKLIRVIRSQERSPENLRSLGKYHRVLSRIYAELGRRDKAIGHFRDGYHIFPGHVVNLLMLNVFAPYREQLLKEFPDLKQDMG
jgi:tetratricopeptide (TPR) repeat protein